MKHLFWILLLACATCVAQTSDDSKRASTNVTDSEYPRVHSDLRVTFQLKAPDAQKVQVKLWTPDNDTYDLTRGADGLWTVTTPPQVPGFHYYNFIIDGAQVADPNSESFFGAGWMASGIEIPEAGVDFYTLKNVPHGQVRQFRYFSAVMQSWRRAFIYTPPDYDVNLKARYPVFLLLHGGGEDERGWFIQGRTDIIMDNLIAEKKAVPMIIIIDTLYAHKPSDPKQAMAITPAQLSAGRITASPTYSEVVTKDLLPAVDKSFRTIPDRDSRAIAGLSLGSAYAMQVGLTNMDKFSYFGSFSGTVMRDLDAQTSYNGVFKNGALFNKRAHLMFIAAGTAEQSRMDAANHARAELDKVGVKHVSFNSQGTAHEWLTWRRDLHEFAPRLFQVTK